MTVYKCYWEMHVFKDCHSLVCADTMREAIVLFERHRRVGTRLQGIVEELTEVITEMGVIAKTVRFP